MKTKPTEASLNSSIAHRQAELFAEQEQGIFRRTDRMFAGLMVFQWLAGIAAAIWISPKTWAGANSQIHLHVWAAVLFGGAIATFPCLLALLRPGQAVTRHVIATGQMMVSALLIHLTGGRIETHFHVFGSLAFLAFYRDWRVLITATVIVAADHFARGVYWPQSVFGVLAASPWRWLEHAGWVLFEDTFLFLSIRQGLLEMRDVAERQTRLEASNENTERQVAARTAELSVANQTLRAEIAERGRVEEMLRTRQAQIHALQDASPLGMFFTDAAGECLYTNRMYERITGLASEQTRGSGWRQSIHPEDIERVGREWTEAAISGGSYQSVLRHQRPDGAVWTSVKAAQVRENGALTGYVGTVDDITERKEAEAKLEEAHKQLLEASRQAGMAEVATGVLHNVGNVLNSVNVSATLVADNLKKSKAANLARVVALLREHSADLGTFITVDAKGKQMPGYLAQLAEHLAGEQEAMVKEMHLLRNNIEHIKEIVAMQQSYAKVSGVTESVKATDLVEDSLRLNAGALARHGIQLVREYEAAPTITVEKHKVLQILVNLVRNAKYACDESGRSDRRLTVRVTNGDDRVRIAVMDNGVGIPPQNLTRIFAHGFTTRKDGHGFGLHSGALAAKEMGGALNVHSDGAGRGATFTLELPLQPLHPVYV